MGREEGNGISSRAVRNSVAVVVCGVVLYVVLPNLIHTLEAWPHLARLVGVWMAAMVIAEVLSFTCSIALLRLVLQTKEWFAVATSTLAGNAVTNVLPGGDAAGAGMQFQMMSKAGIDPTKAGVSLATTSIVGVGALLALPVFALPVLLGGVVIRPGLFHTALLGIGGFVLVAAFGLIALTTDGMLRLIARAISAIARHVPSRAAAAAGIEERILHERDLIRSDLGSSWWKGSLLIGGRVALDFASLLCALHAAGANPNPWLVLLAYSATAVLALVPLTPGGLGVVEASLGGLLVLAGIPASTALLATLAYRLCSYWLPILAGGVSWLLYRRRYR